MNNENVREVIIVGSGPSGYGAAVYNARAYLSPLILAGPEPGGQLTKTTDVENYPGFPEGVMGPKLMAEMALQVKKFGAEIKFETVTSIDFSKRPFKVTTESGEYFGKSILLSMGARSRMLNIGEEKLLGKGVSTCAVCDAAFYKDKVTYVVGGGDSAVEDSCALTKYASEVHMLVRGDSLRASKIMEERAKSKEKLHIHYNSEVKAVSGSDSLTGMKIVSDGQEQEVKVDGLFLAIGHLPATDFIKNSQVKLDKKGFVVTSLSSSIEGIELATSRVKDGLIQYPTMTSVEGVFAAGDVVDFRYKQAASASGMGVMASLDIEWWLENNK